MGSALVFTITAGAVVTPALLGGRGVMMMGQMIYQLVLSTFNWPLGAAAFVLVLCQLVVIALYFRGGNRRGSQVGARAIRCWRFNWLHVLHIMRELEREHLRPRP